MANHLDVLEDAVVLNKQVVTYRWLSRKLGVDVNTAKRMLYDFMNAPRNDPLHAVYYLQGTPQIGDGIVVQLVAEEDLDEAKKQFSHCSVHVYSVQPCRPKNADALFMVDLQVNKEDTVESRRKCRLVQNQNVTIQKALPVQPAQQGRNGAGGSAVPKAEKAAPVVAKPVAAKSEDKAVASFFGKAEQSKSAPAAKESNKSETKKPEPIKKKSSSFFDNFTKGAQPPAKTPSTTPPAGEEEPPKTQPKQKAARVVAESKADKAKRIEQEEELSKMFDGDDEEEAGPSKSAEEAESPGDDMMDEDRTDTPQDSVDEIMEEASPVEAVPPSVAAEPGAETRRVRKRRRVRKQKHVKEGKYLKTVDYSDWESYSEDEAVPPPKKAKVVTPPASTTPEPVDKDETGKKGKKAPAAAKKGDKGGPAKKEQKITSWFTRK